MTYKQLRAAVRAMDKCFSPKLEANVIVNTKFNHIQVTTPEEHIYFAEVRVGKRMVWEPVVWIERKP